MIQNHKKSVILLSSHARTQEEEKVLGRQGGIKK
jgi:hypothetical protein